MGRLQRLNITNHFSQKTSPKSSETAGMTSREVLWTSRGTRSKRADELVAAAIKRLAEVFADERRKVEAFWDKGNDVSTEDCRQALRRYRSLFDRLLCVY